MDRETLQGALPEYFAPWVQALGLRVEAFDGESVTLRLPQDPQLSRHSPSPSSHSASRLFWR